MTKRSKPHAARRGADGYFSKIVRSRGVCERCGDTDQSSHECAHIIRRNRTATRTDERNAWCLCHACHRAVDTNIVFFRLLVERTIGWDTLYELQEKAESHTRAQVRFDWSAERDRLREMWNGRSSR
jgi:hypothetical protein